MTLRPGELVIDDSNFDLHVSPVVNGERVSRGLVPRDYGTYPKCYSSYARDFQSLQMPVIPRSEWVERIREMEATKSRISDVRRSAGPNGGHIPSLDQNGVGYCVPSGTLVLMADGSKKPIEQIQLGEQVWTNLLRARPVLQTHQRLFTGEMIALRIDGTERPLLVTADHPVAVRPPSELSLGFWDMPAGRLEAGQFVYRLMNGTTREFRVRSVGRREVKNLPVFDIGVEEDHHYFAGDSILVHNCWNHSATMCVMLARAIMGLPYVRLSAFFVGCLIKNYRDEGGWGAHALDFICQHGVPSVEFWPEKSMKRSNDRPETRANALLHKVIESWVDLDPPVYDRNLSEDQAMTALLTRCPVIGDFNHWSHSVCVVDPVITSEDKNILATDFGSLDFNNPKDVGIYGAAFGKRLLNSWTDSWGELGEGVLSGSKAILDGGAAVRVTVPSVV